MEEFSVHPQGVAPSETFLWQVGSVDVTAELSYAVLSAIRAQLGRSEEFGGILLGSFETDGETYRTRVDAFEPFAIEHRYGIGFSLSGRDQKRLRQRVERLERGRQRPVGIFRTHHRRGLYLDQRDFDLFSAEFRSPASLFLLVRADEADGAHGAIFVWEGQDIRRHASYLEFAIGDTGVRPTATPAAPASPPAVTVREKPSVPAVAPAAPTHVPSSQPAPRVFAPARPPKAASVPPPAPVLASATIPPSATESTKVTPSGAGPQRSVAPRSKSKETPIRPERPPRLKVVPSREWKLHVRAALPHVEPVHLRVAGLAAAGLFVLLGTFYVGRAVGLRERTEKPAQVTRFAKGERRRTPSHHSTGADVPASAPLSATLREPTPSQAVPFEVPRPDEGGDSVDMPANYRERSVPTVRASVRKPKVWRGAPAAPTALASPAPSLPDPPAVAVNVVPQIPKIATPAAGPQSRPGKRVVAYIKPSQSLLRRLPVLRALSKSSETFVPANPLEHPLPGGTGSADADSDGAVELAAKIDRSGKVINVKTLQGSNDLARASASVLYRWRFEPARQNGEPVDSEMLVRFEFTDSTR